MIVEEIFFIFFKKKQNKQTKYLIAPFYFSVSNLPPPPGTNCCLYPFYFNLDIITNFCLDHFDCYSFKTLSLLIQKLYSKWKQDSLS